MHRPNLCKRVYTYRKNQSGLVYSLCCTNWRGGADMHGVAMHIHHNYFTHNSATHPVATQFCCVIMPVWQSRWVTHWPEQLGFCLENFRPHTQCCYNTLIVTFFAAYPVYKMTATIVCNKPICWFRCFKRIPALIKVPTVDDFERVHWLAASSIEDKTGAFCFSSATKSCYLNCNNFFMVVKRALVSFYIGQHTQP